MAIKALNVGELMREHAALKAKVDRLNVQIKEYKGQMENLELQIGQELKDTGLDSFKRDGYRAEFISKLGYKITDYDALTEYVYSHKAMHLLHRRLLLEPLSEALETGQEIPGVDIYTYPQLAIRKS